MIVIIDNYDSFTYNLLHYFGELGQHAEVVRNDKVTIYELTKNIQSIDAIVISPGPCTPNEAGSCLEIVKYFADKIPILGVCLGHQIIAQSFGGKIVQAIKPVHGKIHQIQNNNTGIFKGLPTNFSVTRYHSLIINSDSLSNDFTVTATLNNNQLDDSEESQNQIKNIDNNENIIMAIEHNKHPVYGVQFHPESIASEYGHDLLKNFIDIVKNYK
ncbi:MAG: aminodeoxychorismate/anthranilate synthase component II, partial [Pseudomonadota bacterium]